MRQSKNGFWPMWVPLLSLFVCVPALVAQQTPAIASTPSASPSPTPTVFSAQTLSELKQLQQKALTSDYAYRQVAHLANNIGPRLSGSGQAAKAVGMNKATLSRYIKQVSRGKYRLKSRKMAVTESTLRNSTGCRKCGLRKPLHRNP